MSRCRFAMPLTLFCFLGLLTACAIRPDVTGRWQQVDAEDTLEFRDDGTFTAVDQTGATVMGRYTLHADGTLYYSVTHTDILKAELTPVETIQIRIAGLKIRHFRNELKIKTEDGDTAEVYRRVY